ncbi:uncharacterized protein LOC141614573 [Silene latifolia]|uniref:uncharacterized protein LOC141614573 n=1 Tax=Silene latifolia TaxID=37657 RepID=UPI003D76AAFB
MAFSDIENNIDLAVMALAQIQVGLRNNPSDTILHESEKNLSNDNALLIKAKHQFLQQKAKTEWIKEGDGNTVYFYASIRSKRSRNKVMQIEDRHGIRHSDAQGINSAFEDYFMQILGNCNNVSKIHIPTMRNGVVLIEEMHLSLTKPVSDEEIKMAMYSILGTKAHGPDGYTSQFIMDTWDIT